MTTTENKKITSDVTIRESFQTEKILTIANAFKMAVDGRFLSTEHASALFKIVLKESGLEIIAKPKELEKKSA